MQFDQFKRREFVSLLGGAVAWPTVARAQQQRRTAHIGVFSYVRENDRQAKVYIEAFLKGVAEFGWSQGSNLRIVYRYTGGSYAGFWVTRRSGGVVCRHLDDLDAVLEFDACDDLRQVICTFESPPGL